jgi:uncharacterized protein
MGPGRGYTITGCEQLQLCFDSVRGLLCIGWQFPKAHRKEGIFEIKALHLEPGVVVDDALVAEVKSALQACAAWHETPRVVVRYAAKPGLAKRLSD